MFVNRIARLPRSRLGRLACRYGPFGAVKRAVPRGGMARAASLLAASLLRAGRGRGPGYAPWRGLGAAAALLRAWAHSPSSGQRLS